jgi:hypothetical protein
LPIPLEFADRLRAIGAGDDELVFKSTVGTLLDPDNVAERVLVVCLGFSWRLHRG